MDRHGFASCVPHHDPDLETKPLIELTSGYVQRALGVLPRQGCRAPWRLYQNYLLDVLLLRFGKMDDGILRFTKRDAFEPAQAAARMKVG